MPYFRWLRYSVVWTVNIVIMVVNQVIWKQVSEKYAFLA